MKYASGLRFALFSAAFLIFLVFCSSSPDWPQFRGSQGNLVAENKDLPSKWNEDTNVVWTYSIDGDGFSSPVIWENKVIILKAVPELVQKRPDMPPPPPPPAQGQAPESRPAQVQPQRQNEDTLYRQDIYRWEIVCIDLNSGAELWKSTAFRGNPRTGKHRMSNYATETPVTDGKRIYAYFGMLGLYCFSMEGELLWHKDLGSYPTLNGWGTGSSPVLYDNNLFIQVDNEEQSFFTALDPVTGNEKWRVTRDEKTNYSTPFIWKNKIRTELVVGGKTARGYDPGTGKILWELSLGGEMSIPSPVANDEFLYLGNTGQRVKGRLFAVKAGASGDITPVEGDSTSMGVAWSVAYAGLGNSSPLLYKGLLYIIASRGGEFTCLHPSNGKQVYKEKIAGVGAVWASPWAYNDKVFFIDENGSTHVIQAGEQFQHLGKNKLDDKIWASVAISGSSLIFRGNKTLYCIKNI